MGAALRFESAEALRATITAGLLPERTLRGSAKLWRQEDGALLISPERALGKRPLAQLAKLGVASASPGKRAPSAALSCWAEALPLARISDETELEPTTVLFCPADEPALLALAAELLRLGCDRQALRLPGGAGGPWLKAVAPPYYTFARALDRADGLAAFLPVAAGDETIWISAGYLHPLGELLGRPADGELLLIDSEGRFELAEDGPWTDIYELLELPLPSRPVARAALAAEERPRLEVRLRLTRHARTPAPTFWLLGDDDATEQLERLLTHLPQREVGRLQFAVTGARERPLVLLRLQPGRQATVELPGEPCAAWREIDNLLLPADAILEPPLRRETLRDLLAPDPDEVVWLSADDLDDPTSFTVQRVAEQAFAPLPEWIDYLVDRDAGLLASWARSVTFDFAPFESTGLEWSDAPPPAAPAEARAPRQRRQRREREAAPQAAEPEASYRPPEPAAVEVEAEPPATVEVTSDSARSRLAELEQRMLELDAPADDAQRTTLWAELGGCNQAAERPIEAHLCWVRARWEAEDLGGREALLPGEQPLSTAKLAGLAATPSPDLLTLQALTRQLAAASALGDADGGRVAGETLRTAQVCLDEHAAPLDVRSRWIARQALSRLVGGDRLQLVRARDAILAALGRGLSVQRDVPTFVRFWGSSLADSSAGEQLSPVARMTAELEALAELVRKTKRARSALEAPEELTRAYVGLVLAYGFARLGRQQRCAELRDAALAALPDDEPIHGLLSAAYAARIGHALEGLPAETALPAEISARLNDLDTFARYKVDRLRQASEVLEPHERLDPVAAFARGEADPRGPEFASMRGMVSADQLGRAVERVLDTALAPATEAEERARLLDGAMDFFPMLSEAQAVPHLRTLAANLGEIAAPRRCDLLQEALMLAGLFSRADLVAELTPRLGDVIGELGSDHPAEVGRALLECVRTMRRLGRSEEAANLLARGADAVAKDRSPAGVAARLQIAAGLADLGEQQQADRALAEGQKALGDKRLSPVDRLRLTRALAQALSYCPADRAVAGLRQLARQLPQISDSFNTNSHFCLSVIAFVEALVLGLASEQLALGERGRRWLDEDEHLIRRRIYRELSADQADSAAPRARRARGKATAARKSKPR